MRSSVITTALMAFAPDAVIVDKVARGLDGELQQALKALKGSAATRRSDALASSSACATSSTTR